MDNTQSHTAKLSVKRVVRCGIVVVLVVSLLSGGAIAGPSLSANQDRNSSLVRSDQSQTGYSNSVNTITIHTKIGRDATIQSYKVQLNMSQMFFARFRSGLKSAGYSSIQDALISIWTKNSTGDFDYNYKKERRGNLVSVTFSFQNHNPPNDVPVKIMKQNGTVAYTDGVLVDVDSSVHYYLTMPGEITNTTADRTDSNTAEWHFSGSENGQTRIAAVSEIPEESGISGMLIPGAVIVGGLVVLVGVVVAFRRRDRV